MLERVAATAQASAPALRLSPLAEYGQLRLQQEHVSNSAAACLPPAACLFRDSAAVRLAPGAAARIRSLERALFNGEKPSLVRLPSGQSIADARLAEAAEAWASYEIQRLQTQLTRSAQQVGLRTTALGNQKPPLCCCAIRPSPSGRNLHRTCTPSFFEVQVQFMEHLITRLTSRPGELAKVRKSKQQLKARMEPVLASLMSWRAGGYVGFDRLPRELRQLAPTIDAARGWAVGKLHA